MVTIQWSPRSFTALLPEEKAEFVGRHALDPELAYRLISGLYARRLFWRVTFSGDFNPQEVSIWERVDWIRKSHHVLRAKGLVLLENKAYMGFTRSNVRNVEEVIKRSYPELSSPKMYQSSHFTLSF